MIGTGAEDVPDYSKELCNTEDFRKWIKQALAERDD